MSFFPESNSVERHQFRKIINKKNIIRLFLLGVVLLFLLGYLYEETQARNIQGGQELSRITINQVSYGYEVAGKGKYTVIVDRMAGETYQQREALKAKFSGNARLFFYDRPGYGASTGPEKTPKEIAEDLHFMFRKFGWPMSFILVGEEYGSLVMQEYLHLYPEEVIGAIFIQPMGESLGNGEVHRYADRKSASFFSREMLGTFGIPRLLQNSGLLDFFEEVRFEDPEAKAAYANLWLSKDFLKPVKKELTTMVESEPLPVKPGLMGENPVYLVTSNRNQTMFKQEEYLAYSSDAQVFTVADSVQDVLLERPQDISSLLNDMIKKIVRLENRK